MNEVEFIFHNVEHGNATHIKSPNGKYIVIDLGATPDLFGLRKTPLEQLIDQNIRNINYLAITHPHRDHIDDILNLNKIMPSILSKPNGVDYEELIANSSDSDYPIFARYTELATRYCNPITDENPDNIAYPHNYGGLSIQIFEPNLDSCSNINNLSPIIVFTYEGLKVVVTGDNEQASFDNLMQQDGFIDAISESDILLAPHHGRVSGFCSEFVRIVKPRLTIVSDGRHVETSCTESYSNLTSGWGIYKNGVEEQRKVLTTRQDGTIKVKIGKNNTNRYINVQAGL